MGSEDQGTPIGRRVVLGLLGLGAVGVVAGGTVNHELQSSIGSTGVGGLLPGAGAWTIYTVTDGYPAAPADYRLRVGGLVDRPLSLSVEELRALPVTRLTRTFQCVTGWSVSDVHWEGVALTDLMTRAGAQPRAGALAFTSFDGTYTESLTMAQAAETGAIVAWSMLGAPVTRDHGGPVRLFVPGMFGYKSIKWLQRVDAVASAAPGYWEQNGYPVNAWIDGHPPAGA